MGDSDHDLIIFIFSLVAPAAHPIPQTSAPHTLIVSSPWLRWGSVSLLLLPAQQHAPCSPTDKRSMHSGTGNTTTLPATKVHLTCAPTQQLGVAWQRCQQQPAAALSQTSISLCTLMQQHSRSTL